MNVTDGKSSFVLAALCILTLVCFILAFYYLRRARLIEDTPTSKIRSATQGYVELEGAVSAGEGGGLIAPLSGIPCVWFHYKIQQLQKSGKNSRWQTINQSTSEFFFQIKDKTGTCTINPKGAQITTEHSRTWYGDNAFPAHQMGDKHSSSLLQSMIQRRYRYTEQFIYVHDVIYALGYFQSQGGGREVPGSHQVTGEILREWKQDSDQLLQKFDQDGNGEIDLNEWQQVRKAATHEAEKRRSHLSQQPTVHVLSKSPNNQHPFILSTHSQKILAKRYRYYAVAGLCGAVISCYVLVTVVI